MMIDKSSVCVSFRGAELSEVLFLHTSRSAPPSVPPFKFSYFIYFLFVSWLRLLSLHPVYTFKALYIDAAHHYQRQPVKRAAAAAKMKREERRSRAVSDQCLQLLVIHVWKIGIIEETPLHGNGGKKKTARRAEAASPSGGVYITTQC